MKKWYLQHVVWRPKQAIKDDAYIKFERRDAQIQFAFPVKYAKIVRLTHKATSFYYKIFRRFSIRNFISGHDFKFFSYIFFLYFIEYPITYSEFVMIDVKLFKIWFFCIYIFQIFIRNWLLAMNNVWKHRMYFIWQRIHICMVYLKCAVIDNLFSNSNSIRIEFSLQTNSERIRLMFRRDPNHRKPF